MRYQDPRERDKALHVAEALDLRHFHLTNSEIIEHAIHARFEITQELRAFLIESGYVEHVAPHIVSRAGACESHDRIFPFDYYDQEAFLVQSAQLYQECLLPKLPKVFCVTQSFRNEQFFKYNHLTESSLLESMSRNSDLESEMRFVEEMFKRVAEGILANRSEAFEFFGYENAASLLKPFERITYREALKLCGKDSGDFSSDDDELITGKMGGPTFVTNFPSEMKFFTTKRFGDATLSADLLLHESGEVMGITETESDPDVLEQQFLESPFVESRKDYEWYFDLHRNAHFSQSGFGMGIERLHKYLCGLPSVTLSVPFARYKGHLRP